MCIYSQMVDDGICTWFGHGYCHVVVTCLVVVPMSCSSTYMHSYPLGCNVELRVLRDGDPHHDQNMCMVCLTNVKSSRYE
eukprot:m.274456 g.274456  ORF g.274456 m.274456 type:complete len:80 (-) comp112990_c0_seq1:276-515(-)